MTSNSAFQPVQGHNWHRGFGPLLRKENRKWWGTRRGLIQSIVWLLILNGLVAAMLFVLPYMTTPDGQPAIEEDPIAMGVQGFFAIGALALSVGVVILAQDEIVAEKESGTAAWILSKPVSRKAFILAKLVAHTIGIMAVLVGLQSLVAYAQLSLAGSSTFPLPTFLAGVGLLALQCLFYLTLTLMMGVLTDSRGTVLAVSLGSLLLGASLLKNVSPLSLITPWALPDVSILVTSGEVLPPILIIPIAATAVWCLVFVGVALWKFDRLEF